MNLLKKILMVLGGLFIVLFVSGLFLMHSITNQTKNENSIDNQQEKQEVTTNSDEVTISLPRESVNKMILRYIQLMPENPMGLNMNWEGKKVQAQMTVPFNGLSVPTTIVANPAISDRQLYLDIESINMSGVPLPKNEAYELMRNNVVLPEGFIYDNHRPSVMVDLQPLLNLPTDLNAQPQKIDLEQGLLHLTINI